MSQIPPNHRLAHRAVLAVSTILSEVDALTETIKNDYGEDLIVQTSLGDSADNFTLLIQVKGTQRIVRADGIMSLSIDIDHLHRWASHGQPVLVCVYNEQSGLIYAFSPRYTISLWEISTSRHKSKTIRLGPGDEFNKKTALRFIWDCRIEHYARMLAWRESHQAYAVKMEGYARRQNLAERELNLITLRFLQDVGVLVGDGVQDEFRRTTENACRSFARTREEGGEAEWEVVDAIALALFGHVDRISGGSGLPAILVERGCRLIGLFFENSHPDNWQRLKECFESAAG